ncbi:hypothetical protein J6590_099017, partial [Homalodisca vitripennis]
QMRRMTNEDMMSESIVVGYKIQGDQTALHTTDGWWPKGLHIDGTIIITAYIALHTYVGSYLLCVSKRPVSHNLHIDGTIIITTYIVLHTYVGAYLLCVSKRPVSHSEGWWP